MIRRTAVGVLLAVASLAAQPRETTTETWTGGFSDKQCARVMPGEYFRGRSATSEPGVLMAAKRCP